MIAILRIHVLQLFRMNITIHLVRAFLILVHYERNQALGKKEDIEKIASLIHNLYNITGITELSMNWLNNANVNTLEKRWVGMRDALMVTGEDRINKEIDLFRNERKAIESVSMETYMDIYDKLSKADKSYKSMLDILVNSKEYSDKTKDTTFFHGNKTVYLLKHIINSLEVIRIEL